MQQSIQEDIELNSLRVIHSRTMNIVPHDFIRNVQTKDFYPDNWIKLNY